MIPLRLRSCVALAALPLLCLTGVGRASAAVIKVVTPGEQNTASGENGCAITMTTCNGGTWHHYPELLQIALGSGYSVENNGDGGAILGCGTMSSGVAGSFCSSSQYATSIATPAPDIVIIGPFGEHDQRILVSSAANMTNYYKESVFQDAYEGLVQKYLALMPTVKIFMMTPIDITFSATALPGGDDIVKDVMLPAAKAVAAAHNLTIVDTYTAISGTSTLATMYTNGDGQVTSAGQQKMAMLIEAALAGGGTGAGGAGGAAGASGAAGAGAAGAGAAGAGAAGAGAAGSAGAAGAGGGTAAAGANGAAGVVGTAGTTGGAAGVSGTTTGAAGQAGGAAGEPGAAGATGAAGAAVQGRETSGGGCSIAAAGARSWGGGLALAMAALVGLARRRRSRR